MQRFNLIGNKHNDQRGGLIPVDNISGRMRLCLHIFMFFTLLFGWEVHSQLNTLFLGVMTAVWGLTLL